MHPDRIGPYLIDRKIGAGGMGNVYRGTHEETGDVAAVKVLPASIAREEGFVHRFSREIDALRKVSSPNVVQIFSDGQTEDGSFYFSMEFVDGETLTAMISRRKRIPWQEVIEISQQICTALKAAHDAGIIHRDIKPSNLMITKDGTVKLADFGVAHVFAATRLTRTGGVVGTAEYMSPEQARGQRATKLSDLYSLGAVMYVMLTGRPPFTGKTAADILHKHQFAQFDRPSHFVPELPRRLEDFVCKLLEKRPDRRLPDAFVVIRQLANIRSRIEYELDARESTHVPELPEPGRTSRIAPDSTSLPQQPEVELSRGPATIVRDAIREDLEEQLKKSPVAAFFDNTFVLLTLLVLVLAAGWYLFQHSNDPVAADAENLDDVREIFSEPPGRDWLRARDEILIPLNTDDLSPQERAEVESLVQEANDFEFTSGLQASWDSDGSARSEIHRLIVQAHGDYARGEVAAATQQLQDVLTLLGDKVDSHLHQFVRDTLILWTTSGRNKAKEELLHEVVDFASQALDADKSDLEILRQCRDRLESVIRIYESDTGVEDLVEECRRLQEQIVERIPASTEPREAERSDASSD